MNRTCTGITAKILVLVLALLFFGRAADAEQRLIETYDIGQASVRVKIMTSSMPTVLEGRIKEESGFYFFKMKFMDNFFSINVPERSYQKMDYRMRQDLVATILILYGRSFEQSSEMLSFLPKGYRFNMTFGRTQSGHPFNRVYVYSKTSNIFPDLLPYKSPLMPGRTLETPITGYEEWVMLHEMAHSIFAMAVGSIRNPKNRFMEEGFADYFAERVMGRKSPARESLGKIPISAKQAARLEGLSQLDVDAAIWGEERALNVPMEGYVGVTHHHFGYEFISAYVEVFGDKNLRDFLHRFSQTEEVVDKGDYGTKRIKNIFLKMGYTPREIALFRRNLHEKLLKNVFEVTG
ncbi:MAG: hypothetical protein GF409_07965 [Candidatus Omnitrophica bacterium]|nr:hypothetical protein [Candidatus Omnitrophota bacterium]